MPTTQHDAISAILDDAEKRLQAYAEELTSERAAYAALTARAPLTECRKRLREALAYQHHADAEAL